MAGKDLLSYEEHKDEFRKPAQRPGLNEAIWEIEEDPGLEQSEGGSLLRELEGTAARRGGRVRDSK